MSWRITIVDGATTCECGYSQSPPLDREAFRRHLAEHEDTERRAGEALTHRCDPPTLRRWLAWKFRRWT